MYGARARTHGSEPDRADDEMEPRVRKAVEKGPLAASSSLDEDRRSERIEPIIESIVRTAWRAIVGDYVDGVVATGA